MKLCKKENGFIAISIVYSFFVIFLIIILVIMYSYLADRKSANKVKNEIKNEFKIKAPIVSISPTGSDEKNASYSVKINVTDSGNGISSIGYAWSTNQNYSSAVSLTSVANGSTISSPTAQGKYYLFVKACDVDQNCQTLISQRFVVGS